MYLYIGGRRMNRCKSRKYFRTPHRRSGGPLGGGGGYTMIVMGEVRTGRTSLGIFLPMPPRSQVLPITSVWGGGVCRVPPLLWCCALLRTLGALLFGKRGWTPGSVRLCPPPAPVAPLPRRRNGFFTCQYAQISSGRAVYTSDGRHNACCTHP